MASYTVHRRLIKCDTELIFFEINEILLIIAIRLVNQFNV